MRPNNWLTNSLSNLQLQASRRAQQCRRSASCQLAPLANNSNRAVKSVIRARKLIGALILVGSQRRSPVLSTVNPYRVRKPRNSI
jgi:hypothetical protein